jgi:hypothetical protein
MATVKDLEELLNKMTDEQLAHFMDKPEGIKAPERAKIVRHVLHEAQEDQEFLETAIEGAEAVLGGKEPPVMTGVSKREQLVADLNAKGIPVTPDGLVAKADIARVLAGNLVCEHCLNDIRPGEEVVFKGKNFHPACAENQKKANSASKPKDDFLDDATHSIADLYAEMTGNSLSTGELDKLNDALAAFFASKF